MIFVSFFFLVVVMVLMRVRVNGNGYLGGSYVILRGVKRKEGGGEPGGGSGFFSVCICNFLSMI